MFGYNPIDTTKSWTDDLPKCKHTGVGFTGNNFTCSQFPKKITDRFFNCEIQDNICLYVIFSGHNGSEVADLSMQHMPAEIIFDQLRGKNTDEEVREVLKQSFISVEKSYQNSIDNLLAQKACFQCNIAEHQGNEAESLSKLTELEQRLNVGASIALCLTFKNKLFICNVGTCRVLLCKIDENKAPRVIQFSVDHNLSNSDEALRLEHLGLNANHLRSTPIFETRAIGCYQGKGGFKDSQYLKGAKSEPILSQPEIVGGIMIDNSSQFLILMSSGACKILNQIYCGDTAQENREIIKMCSKEFECQSSLTEVAQSVVEKLVNLYHQKYPGRFVDDVSIILRNFQMPKRAVHINSDVEDIPLSERSTYTTGSNYSNDKMTNNIPTPDE
ncbi:TAB1 family protein [Megaselia abdita]